MFRGRACLEKNSNYMRDGLTKNRKSNYMMLGTLSSVESFSAERSPKSPQPVSLF